MTTVILFVLGLIFGSFLNVVAMRWDTGRGVGGRSTCPQCGRTLKWWELVPVLSYFLLRARCSECKSRISLQYPLVELWTALIFVTVPLILLPVFCIYIVITVYDAHHKIIPDRFVYTAIVVSLVIRAVLGGALLDWLAGPILFGIFALIWFATRGRAMGFGDAKLALSVGLLLGARAGFSAIVLAFWIGAAVTLLYLAIQKSGFLNRGKGLTMKSEVPFAPFIILGAWLSLISHIDLLHVALF
jgi:leader peptidase (prepilin peptidase)/N-methyltransferase